MAGLAVLFATFDGSVLSLALPAIAHDFGASVAALSNLGSALAIGSVGALPLAALADRIGRRRLIATGVLAFAAANLLSAGAPSLQALGGLRVVAGGFESLVISVTIALVVEEVPDRHRGLAVAWITIAAGGGTFLTIVAYPFLAPHWRQLYLLGGIALPIAGLLWRFLPEGRTWAAAAAARPRGSALRLLLDRRWRGRIATIAGFAILNALLLGPASLFVALFGSRRLSLTPAGISTIVFVAGLVSVPAFLAGGRLSDRYGRRLPGTLVTAAAAVAAGATFTGSLGAYWAGNVVWSVLASLSVPVLGAWFGELFPTRARATSQAVVAVSTAVGGAIGLQVVGLLDGRWGLGPAIVAVAAGAILGAVLLLLLPETSGQPLAD